MNGDFRKKISLIVARISSVDGGNLVEIASRVFDCFGSFRTSLTCATDRQTDVLLHCLKPPFSLRGTGLHNGLNTALLMRRQTAALRCCERDTASGDQYSVSSPRLSFSSCCMYTHAQAHSALQVYMSSPATHDRRCQVSPCSDTVVLKLQNCQLISLTLNQRLRFSISADILRFRPTAVS